MEVNNKVDNNKLGVKIAVIVVLVIIVIIILQSLVSLGYLIVFVLAVIAIGYVTKYDPNRKESSNEIIGQ